MRGLFIHELGACSCAPFKLKCDGGLSAAIISGAAALGSAAISGITASNLNKDNRNWQYDRMREQMQYNSEEARLAREHQSGLLTQEQQWNEYMYNMYNSPSALRRQYTTAGYNPYLVDGQGISGQSFGNPSASNGAQASSPSVGTPQTFMPDFSGLSGAGESIARSVSLAANVANQSQDTVSKAISNYIEMAKLGIPKDARNSYLMNAISQIKGTNFDADRFVRRIDLDLEAKEISNNRAALENSIYQEFGRTEKADKIMLMEQEFDRIAKEIGYYASLGKLNDAKVDEIASIITKNLASAGLDDANSELIWRSMDFLVKQAKYEAKLAKTNSNIQEGEYGLRKPIYDASQTGVGQTVEQLDYYSNKLIDKVGNIGKINIGFGRNWNQSRSYSNVWSWQGNY